MEESKKIFLIEDDTDILNLYQKTCCEIIVFYTRIKTNFSKNRLNWPFNILKQKIGILGIKLTFLPKV